ncbi:MAG: hypothetical protein DMG39_05320 [Acidobacteria bacterium]|nr:MAG: hypothetical protein DMG39_05320 [Acidobacteriota bacterium]
MLTDMAEIFLQPVARVHTKFQEECRGGFGKKFSTDLVPVSDRLEAWRCNAQKICGDSRFQFPKTRTWR